MRIISPFKDYYDIGMQYGYDPKLQWIRRTSEIDLDRRRWKEDTISLHFCGEVYNGLITPSTKSYCVNSMGVIWDNDSYAKYCVENNIKPMQLNWFDVWTNSSKFDTKSRVIPLGKLEKSSELNDKYKSPIVLEMRNKLEVNPYLKFLQFYKVYDPVTTYQKISEYFGNKFFNEPKMVPISDKDRIKQHGFDEKSFRMAKSRSK